MVKGGNMKKALIVFVALMLALPAVSFAGSATSRWDMTIGGMVKLDIVHNTNANGGIDFRAPARDDQGGQQTFPNKAKTLNWGATETRLSWAVKGPGLGSAKTAAFVEAEFRGTTWSQQGASNLVGAPYGTGSYGMFALRHAYMQMIWPKTTLLLGHTWQPWGTIPALNILGLGENHMNKGWTRIPQIRLTQAFSKSFTGVFALAAPYDTLTQQNVTQNPGANSLYPNVSADFSWATDACGKIGAFNMKFGLGGFWGKDKFWWNSGTAAAGNFHSKELQHYGAGFYWYVPIIPEKKVGARAGALGFAGQLYAGKGLGLSTPNYGPVTSQPTGWAAGNGAYVRSPMGPFVTNQVRAGATSLEAAYPMSHGGWAQATFFLSDKWFVNGLYGIHVNNVSNAYVNSGAFGGNVRDIQNYIVNVMYEPNPAIRLGVEWYHVIATYAARSTATQSSHGKADSFRFAGYYFF
jgi:hypothetical protein